MGRTEFYLTYLKRETKEAHLDKVMTGRMCWVTSHSERWGLKVKCFSVKYEFTLHHPLTLLLSCESSRIPASPSILLQGSASSVSSCVLISLLICCPHPDLSFPPSHKYTTFRAQIGEIFLFYWSWSNLGLNIQTYLLTPTLLSVYIWKLQM